MKNFSTHLTRHFSSPLTDEASGLYQPSFENHIQKHPPVHGQGLLCVYSFPLLTLTVLTDKYKMDQTQVVGMKNSTCVGVLVKSSAGKHNQ